MSSGHTRPKPNSENPAYEEIFEKAFSRWIPTQNGMRGVFPTTEDLTIDGIAAIGSSARWMSWV